MDLNDDTFSADETAFFESGGESGLPEGGADDAGNDSGVVADTGGKVEGAVDPAAAAKAPSTVPLAALHEERSRRRDLDKTLRDTQQQLAELRGKFSIIEKLNVGGADQQQQQQGPIDPADDIFGAVRQVGETVAQMQKRLEDQAAATEAAAKAETAQKSFVDNYRADADAFEKGDPTSGRAATPDFKAAYSFLLESRARELQAIGYETPQALHEALVADEMALAQMAFDKGKSPAEMFYTLAKQRGYKPGAASREPGKGGAERLDTIQRGQQAHKSLSSAGGSSGDADMTAEQLVAMSAADFEAWCEKNPAKAKRIMGG